MAPAMKLSDRSRDALEAVALPLVAMGGALLLFGAFIWAGGKSPLEAWLLLFKGAFGDWFSWQNTLQRAAPLMLTALCVAIPARAGLTIIGGEGALVLGGLACAGLPYLFAPPDNVIGTAMILAAAAVAGAGGGDPARPAPPRHRGEQNHTPPRPPPPPGRPFQAFL